MPASFASPISLRLVGPLSREPRLPLRVLVASGLLALVIAVPSARAAEAPEDEGQPLALEPITVTGEKTLRSLRETAASVTVLGAEEIESLPGAATFDDVVARLPNVLDTGTGNFAPTIRGVDSTGPANGVFAFLGGTRPRVTIQLDGRPLTFNELIYGRAGLWDVERVEVFRGPQTTLQGRNSIAGAIIIDTKDPTFEYEAAVRALRGNYDTRQYSGMVSGPILEDQLAFRLTVDQRYHDSFVKLTDPTLVPRPREEEATTLRGKLLFLPKALPAFSAKLTLNHADSRRPQTELVSRPFDERTLDNSTPGFFPVFENDSDSSILDLSYFLTDNLELRNTTTFAQIEVARLTEPGTGIADIQTDQFTNELLLDYGAPGGRVHVIAGTYYFKADSDEAIDIGNGMFKDNTETVALFGETTITFWRKLDLTLGARYEHEERERLGSAGIFMVDFDETYNAFLPKVGLAYRPSERFTYGATVERGYNAGGAGVAFVAPFPSYSYDEEYVWNYELFFRSSWLDERLTVNANVFYADYEDQQRLAFLDPNNPSSGVIRNAESTQTYGAEVTTTWLAARGLEVFAAVGLLDTEIEEFSAANKPLVGNAFARAPEVSASFGTLYEHASGLALSLDGRYVGDYYSDDDNLAAEEIDSRLLFNAEAGYDFGDVRLFTYVTNIFDEDNKVLIFQNSAQLVDPREYGIGLEARF